MTCEVSRPGPYAALLPLRASTVAAVLALTTGCVFMPPAPLDGELALSGEPSGHNMGTHESPVGEEGDSEIAPEPTGGPADDRFERGQEPPVGMSLADILAFNRAQGDPVDGFFELDQALAGLPEEGELWVEFVTGRGVIDCKLFEDLAPTTVANFVGLARGLRPWYDQDRAEWVSGEPYYDDTTFHRVIPSFMIQGGDPTGTGRGNPGYVIPDEIRAELGHDGGALSMANKGAGTGSAQFFIVLEPVGHLNGLHSVFGRCTAAGVDVGNAVAGAAVGANDKPVDDEVLRTVRIVRRPASN